MTKWRVYRNGTSSPTKIVEASEFLVKERAYLFLDKARMIIAAFPINEYYVLREVS